MVKFVNTKSRFIGVNMQSKKVLLITLAAALLLGGCSSSGSNESEASDKQESSTPSESSESAPGGCQSSSREEPIGGAGSVSCENWSLSVSEATLIPNQAIYDENQFNDVSDSKSWVVVTVKATYKGEGKGNLSDVVSSRSFLIGKNNLTYENDPPVNDGFEEEFGPDYLDAGDPYSGGTSIVSLWFWVENTDSDLLLALNVDNTYNNDPNVWVQVGASRS